MYTYKTQMKIVTCTSPLFFILPRDLPVFGNFNIQTGPLPNMNREASSKKRGQHLLWSVTVTEATVRQKCNTIETQYMNDQLEGHEITTNHQCWKEAPIVLPAQPAFDSKYADELASRMLR